MAGKKGMRERLITSPKGLVAWPFYVYEILDAGGNVTYIGKGMKLRMHASQKARSGASAREVARFKKERDAYAFERSYIAEIMPPLNKVAGGGGHRCQKIFVRASRPDKWTRMIEEIGTRAYAARVLLKLQYVIKNFPSKVAVSKDEFQKMTEWAATVDLASLRRAAYG